MSGDASYQRQFMITLLKKWIVGALRAASRKDTVEFNRLGMFYYFLTRSVVRSAWLAFWHRPNGKAA